MRISTSETVRALKRFSALNLLKVFRDYLKGTNKQTTTQLLQLKNSTIKHFFQNLSFNLNIKQPEILNFGIFLAEKQNTTTVQGIKNILPESFWATIYVNKFN